MRLIRSIIICLIVAGCGVDPVSRISTKSAKTQFGTIKQGSDAPSHSIGGYAKGCLAGAQQLDETGPTWQAMRLSRNRNWGHHQAIDFVHDLSKFAAKLEGWKGLYIGDISQPRGGPMLTGHASHQIGLDIDIWMNPVRELDLTIKQREMISAISMRRANGAYVNTKWSKQHHAILRAAAQDDRVARIFVFPGAKMQMCADETGDRSWLRKIRPWWGHHYHFHVRLKCPKGSKQCIDQTPPPVGDGCAAAQTWVNDILHPPAAIPSKPYKKPRIRPIVLDDLPFLCAELIE